MLLLFQGPLHCVCSVPPFLAFWLASGASTSSLYCTLSTAASAREDREDTERRGKGNQLDNRGSRKNNDYFQGPGTKTYHDAGAITAVSASGSEDNGKQTHKEQGIPHSLRLVGVCFRSHRPKTSVLRRSLLLHLMCTLGAWGCL